MREFQTSPSNCLHTRSWVTFKESYRLMNSRGYQIPKVSTIFKQGVSFFSKNNPVFSNSKIPSYSKNRGNVKRREFHSSRSNCLYTRNWVDFKESNHSQTSPRLFYSKIMDYFRTAGISNTGSFILFQKLPLFFQFQNRGDVKHREFHSSTWNSRFSARWVRWREFHPPPPHIHSRFLEFLNYGLF